uniref:FAD-binding PCMH-type domain-containing protein n=1 Tax=Electrophorus electricus TaxID=8005 RepID=A0A4W4EHP9_ELEEL
ITRKREEKKKPGKKGRETCCGSEHEERQTTTDHLSANACLMPICQLHGAAVTTVEGIGNTKTRLHPVQERIAKAHGSQCGFCTPGMVMSMYTLLRNKPKPSMEDITEALGGNLCRCTGYQEIIDGYRTFCEVCHHGTFTTRIQADTSFLCYSKTSEADQILKAFSTGKKKVFMLITVLPQSTLKCSSYLRYIMAESPEQTTQKFHGERMTWISPITLDELVQLKTQYPQAPVVMGNTNVGEYKGFKGVLHPIIISPTRVRELFGVEQRPEGVCIGAGCSLSTVQSVLERCVCSLPAEHTQTYAALLGQLRHVGGQQIRNVATLGGNVASAYPNSDLNPILAAGRCSLLLQTKEGKRRVPLDKDFFVGFRKTTLRPDELVLSVFIPISRKGEVVRAFRHAPRKTNALPTVTTGMRVWFHDGSDVVREMSVYYGGVGACTFCAERTSQQVTGRPWNEATLNEAYRVLVDEVTLGVSAPGGQVVFRRSLTLSLFFRFYLHVLQYLKDMQNSAMEPLPCVIGPGYQEFQVILTLHHPITLCAQVRSAQDPVGQPVPHSSALTHATGEAVYCDDIPHMNREVFLSLVTSTKAHAKIIHIDVSRALDMPGVVDVITAKDIPGQKFQSFTGINEEVLVEEEVRVTCVGQIICAVVADTKQHGKLAAAALKVTYEDLPDRIFTTEEAVEQCSFYAPQRTLQRGDIHMAFQEAEHIYEGEIRVGGQEHFYMETQSMLVIPAREQKEVKVYLSTQHPTCAQMSVAETLGIPANRVSCHVKRVGGAFGGKITKASILACITAVAAWKTERPVRCVLERGEDMLITGGRHPVLGKYKVGFMNDGKIIAADVHYFVNAGNTPDESVLVRRRMLVQLDNAYNIPNLRGQSVACKTNLPSSTAFRGFGVPQSMVVIENMIHDVAMTLGRPAEEVRDRMNLYKGLSRTHYKMEFDPENLHCCWVECKKRSELGRRRPAVAEFNRRNRWKKRGIAMVPIKYGVGFGHSFLQQAAALVHIYKDGSVLVSHGGIEMGQGLHTKVQQVVSRELNIPLSLIHISETCTSAVPNTNPTAASFGTDANGMAVWDACQTLYKRLEPVRKKDPSGTWKSWIATAFQERISLSATGFYRFYVELFTLTKPYTYFTYAVCCSEVELDCLTGEYRTVRADIVVDIGKSINPAIDIGQIKGAFMQGLGLYTMEELKFSPSGSLHTRGPGQYKIPAVCDVPLQFNVYLLPGSQNPFAIYSSKGIGEPIVFLGSSVFFAMKEAITAARTDVGLSGPFPLRTPATPEHACLACNTHFNQMIPKMEAGTSPPWAMELP